MKSEIIIIIIMILLLIIINSINYIIEKYNSIKTIFFKDKELFTTNYNATKPKPKKDKCCKKNNS